VNSDLKYCRSLLLKLIDGREEYFHDDYINSDGRKILEEVFKILIYNYPWLRERVRKLRKNPCFDNIVKFYNDIQSFIS